ncbi:ABC transporter ATP-binding protein [Sedimentibacter sp. zth1]|uniref:ABC transporter ATP-binding protein n=1 Tax=Sedimentibacter sp. zth1 TaxID=2816908 RepID=UPI001A928BE2|nr:ABC transporter ATP-binding protein [Sedimentibacter sp. zth1]QSX04715.1 ABC transporter ATP-binding protein [Sedimentibacter sp. zth1]
MTEKLLEVKDLRTSFFTHLGEVKAIRGINFHVNKSEAIGIVGESGSGKSVTSLSIMKLLLYPGKIVGGEILFKGEDLVKKTNKEMMDIRGNNIAMIFQDPMTALNPLFTIGNQISESILKHQNLSKKDAKEKSIEMLKLVGIPDPEKRIKNYPHEYSGGMRQRAMIAMALSCEPELLIADEPTTALDVTIQAQILELMKQLNKQFDTSTILITHDLGVVSDVCERIVVMYGGLIMEQGSKRDIFYSPMHPYTMGLLKSIPRVSTDTKIRLLPIQGTPPDLLNPPIGCPFASRCDYAMKICAQKQPPYFVDEKNPNHQAMCWLLHKDAPFNKEYEGQKGGVKVNG